MKVVEELPIGVTSNFRDRYDDLIIEALIVLIVAFYYLGPNGQVNSYPSYLLTLFLMLNPRIWPRVAYIVKRSSILQSLLVLEGFMFCSFFWSRTFTYSAVSHKVVELLLVTSFLLALGLLGNAGKSTRILGWIFSIASASAIWHFWQFTFDRNDQRFPWVEHPFYFLTSCTFPHRQPVGYDQLVGCRRWYWSDYHFGGRLQNPVVAAFAFGFSFVVGAILLTELRRYAGIILVSAGMLLMLILIYLTGSMGVYLGLAAVLVVMLLRMVKFVYARGLILFAVVCVGLFILLHGRQILPRGFSHRGQIWHAVLTRVHDNHLVFGLGLLTDPSVRVGHVVYQHAHSVFMSSFYYGGIVGLCAFMVTVALIAKQLLLSPHLKPRLLPLLFAFALGVLILDGYLDFGKVDYIWLILWLPIGMLLGNEVAEKS